MTSVAEPAGPAWLATSITDPLVKPMLRELGHEYSTRYGKDAHYELTHYPTEEFEPPHGALLLLLEGGEPVAGGAFRRYDATTAELKRIWTHSAHRRRGLARRVVLELERVAVERGYHRVYLTTGPRQPEARGLYLSTGYTPLFDTAADPETIGPLPFEKRLPPLLPLSSPSSPSSARASSPRAPSAPPAPVAVAAEPPVPAPTATAVERKV